LGKFLKVLKQDYPQCGRVADDRREGVHNVDGLQTTVGGISTMWKPEMNKSLK
jgi:hypothetical protein